jgi:hypothetical protein
MDNYVPHIEHSPTSEAAAITIAPLTGRLLTLVYRYILGCGESGATDEEIQIALNMAGSTERPRRIELLARGKVRDSGRTRPTLAGRAAVVWVDAEGGEEPHEK